MLPVGHKCIVVWAKQLCMCVIRAFVMCARPHMSISFMFVSVCVSYLRVRNLNVTYTCMAIYVYTHIHMHISNECAGCWCAGAMASDRTGDAALHMHAYIHTVSTYTSVTCVCTCSYVYWNVCAGCWCAGAMASDRTGDAARCAAHTKAPHSSAAVHRKWRWRDTFAGKVVSMMQRHTVTKVVSMMQRHTVTKVVSMMQRHTVTKVVSMMQRHTVTVWSGAQWCSIMPRDLALLTVMPRDLLLRYFRCLKCLGSVWKAPTKSLLTTSLHSSSSSWKWAQVFNTSHTHKGLWAPIDEMHA